MKNIFYTVFGLLLFIGNMSSQEAKERKMTMSLGAQNAWYVDIEGADSKLAEKVFYEHIKSFGKMKYNKKAKEHFLISTPITLINGSSPLDIYAKFDETKTQATAYVWVDMGGAFINDSEHPKQAKALKSWMTDYYLAVKREVILNEIKGEEKKLSSLDKELKRLTNKNESLHKDIEKAQKQIAEAEKEIEKNIVDQENKNKEIEAQKEIINKVNERLNNLGRN